MFEHRLQSTKGIRNIACVVQSHKGTVLPIALAESERFTQPQFPETMQIKVEDDEYVFKK